PGVDEQTKQQQDCMVALNGAGAKVAKAVGKRLTDCVRAATRGELPAGMTAQSCVTSDPRGRIADASAATDEAAAKKCPLVPTFGPATSAAVNTAMTGILRPQDVFGPDLDATLLDAHVDPAGAHCQETVAKTVVKVALAKLNAFNKCKTSGLRNGAIRGPADLEVCHGAMTGPSVAKAMGKAQKTAAKGCADADLATALPGRCATVALDDVGACLEGQVGCGACIALDAGDRLGAPPPPLPARGPP